MRNPMRAMALILPLALAACGQKPAQSNLDSLDAALVGNTANGQDPALKGALQDQIMVDPALAQQSNADAIRPPAQPYSGAVPPENVAVPSPAAVASAGAATSEALKTTPAASGSCPQCAAARQSLTLGALAARQRDKRTSGCAGSLHYSARRAERLPADIPLYPDARVSEAAGADSGGCAMRAVSFASAAPLQTVLDWYYTRTTKAGYSAEHKADGAEHVLGGTRDSDNGAFALFLTSRSDGGTDVDLLANNGT